MDYPYVAEKKKARLREYARQYAQRPEVKERRRAYMAEYTKRPEVMARRNEYNARYAQQQRINRAIDFLKEHGYSVIKEENA